MLFPGGYTVNSNSAASVLILLIFGTTGAHILSSNWEIWAIVDDGCDILNSKKIILFWVHFGQENLEKSNYLLALLVGNYDHPSV